MIQITIDNVQVEVEPELTILQAAERVGIAIPRLCYHPELSVQGACRVCIVALEGSNAFVASCATKVQAGMKIHTHTPEIRQARRDLIELLLDNHPQDCQTCERDGDCELQRLAYVHGVRTRDFAGKRKRFARDISSEALATDPEKCILCGRCIRVCREIQGVCNLSQHGRGFTTKVQPAYGQTMKESVCIQCGQCINVCPTAAFLEHSHTAQVFKALADPQKHVVVQVAPSIRAAIGEGFGYPPGTPCTGKMVTALKRLGFAAVFDTDLAADLTIMEEAHEFLRRLKGEGPLPLLTSCSPGWVKFLEHFYPELIPHASTCRSPMGMMASLLKSYYAEQQNLDPQQIFSVAVMPCVAKKYEAARPEFRHSSGVPLTDAVLTTRELIWMIKSLGIHFESLAESEFDAPLGISTGAGVIFGSTGGVMEATLRTAAELLTGDVHCQLEFQEVRAVEGLREVSVQIGGQTLQVAVANGLAHAKEILNKVVKGEANFQAIEIMACPGGCIGGGGQPYPPRGVNVLDRDLLAKRAQALYQIDGQKTLRRAHHNPALQQLYKEYLGEPGSHKAHELLHTHYEPRLPKGIR